MAEGSGVKNISLGFIRRMPAGRSLMCCLPCHAFVLGLSVFLFVAQPLAQLQSRRQEEADRVSARESMLVLRERGNRARAELHRYAPDVQSHGSVVKDVLLNRLFDRATAMASELGVTVQLFERAGQGLDKDGFARVTFDTNFLQMAAFVDSLSRMSLPVKVEEFHASHNDKNSDMISFSLAFSVARVATIRQSQCSP